MTPGSTMSVGGDRAARVVCARDELVAALRCLRADDALRQVQDCRAALTAVEAQVLAAQYAAGKSDRDVVGSVSVAGTSKRNARAAARRGAAAAANPTLVDETAAGSLSTDQFDVLADAAALTGGAAACDRNLIEQVASLPPDQGRRVAADWARDHADPEALETEHARQRHRRHARRWITRDGLDAITAAGDRASIDQLWNLITAEANRLYQRDGGRDVTQRAHPRSHQQRLFDATATLLEGRTGSQGPGRSTVVVTVDVNALGTDGSGAGEIVGSGPIPDSLLAKITSKSNVVGAIFDRDGQALWLGRKRRRSSAAQDLALVIRDKGCVLCGAHHSRCAAHHLMPWNAPGRGRTDIDQLALVCHDDHHFIHDNHLTLERLTDGEWKTRPATPDEIPPPHHRSGSRPKRE